MGRLPMIWLAVASSRGAAFTGSQQEAAAMVLEAAGCWTTIQQQFAWTAPSVKVEMTFDLRPSSLSNTALTVTCWLAALAPLIEQNRKEGLYEAHSGEMCMITVVWCKKEGNSIYLKEGHWKYHNKIKIFVGYKREKKEDIYIWWTVAFTAFNILT